jgi:hypothetical protein
MKTFQFARCPAVQKPKMGIVLNVDVICRPSAGWSVYVSGPGAASN